MKIEPAVSEDIPAIARAQVRSWQAAYERIVPAEHLANMSVERRAALWRELISRSSPELLVARDNDYVVGFIAFGRCRDEGATAGRGEVWALYVMPSHWSQGVGTRLWRGALTRLMALGYDSVSLWALADNQRAAQFYARMGCVPEEDSVKEVVIGGKALSEIRYIAEIQSRS